VTWTVAMLLLQRGGGAARQLPMPEDPVQLIALGAFIVALILVGLKLLGRL
jgi:hypothetical protein